IVAITVRRTRGGENPQARDGPAGSPRPFEWSLLFYFVSQVRLIERLKLGLDVLHGFFNVSIRGEDVLQRLREFQVATWNEQSCVILHACALELVDGGFELWSLRVYLRHIGIHVDRH